MLDKPYTAPDTPGSVPRTAPSKTALWAGWILSGLVVAFMLLDGGVKLAKPSFVVEASEKAGVSEDLIIPLGVIVLVCTIIYAIPKTAILGAILLTGYLGGAVWAHMQKHDPLFNILFPVIFGVLLWVGLYLREPRLRALAPIRSGA